MNGILCGVVFRMTYDFYMFWNEKVRCHRSRIFIFFFALHRISTSLALYRQYKLRDGCNEMVSEISLGFFVSFSNMDLCEYLSLGKELCVLEMSQMKMENFIYFFGEN